MTARCGVKFILNGRARISAYTPGQMPNPNRPDLRFDSYDQLLADVQSLHTAGWEKAGQWTLAMICDHLARWTNGMLDEGLPHVPGPFQWIPRLIIHRMVRKQSYPSIVFPAPSTLKPAIDLSESAAIASMTTAINRLQQLAGPVVETHPFGAIAADDFRGMTLLHAAHHLGFLQPR